MKRIIRFENELTNIGGQNPSIPSGVYIGVINALKKVENNIPDNIDESGGSEYSAWINKTKDGSL